MSTRPVILALVAAFALALAPSALAASRPGASTGPARFVVAQSATLTATVNPRGEPTSYFFQYGTTTHYGKRTQSTSAGSGRRGVHILVPVNALKPRTKYHFRVVAFSPAGTTRGRDRTFTTPRLPVIVTIAPTANPVPFGTPLTITGHVQNAPAGTPVVLQQRTFPYIVPFAQVGNAQLTDAAGNFAFPGLVLPQAAQFRVVRTTGRHATSAILSEQVAVLVTLHHKVRRARRGAIVRFYGSVLPPHDGSLLAIQKFKRGRWVTVRGASLHHRSSRSSRYSVHVRIRHSGTYRTFVQVVDGSHTSGISRTLRVHMPRRR